MQLSNNQHIAIRNHVKNLYLYGPPTWPRSKKMSWPQVFEEIVSLMDEKQKMNLQKSFQNDTSDDNLNEYEKQFKRQGGEKIRQYVEGITKDSKRVRIPHTIIEAIIDYITSPDGLDIDYNELFDHQNSLRNPTLFCKQIWNDNLPSEPLDQILNAESEATYHLEDEVKLRNIFITFYQSENIESNLILPCAISMYEKNPHRFREKLIGFAFLIPPSIISIFVKSIHDSRTEYILIRNVDAIANSKNKNIIIAEFIRPETGISLSDYINIDTQEASELQSSPLQRLDFGKKLLMNIASNSFLFQRIKDFYSTLVEKDVRYEDKNGPNKFGFAEKDGELSIDIIGEIMNNIEIFEHIMDHDLERIREYFDSGNDINLKHTDSGKIVAHFIAATSSPELTDLFCAQDGINFLAKDKEGRTPSDIAILTDEDEHTIRKFIEGEKLQIDLQ